MMPKRKRSIQLVKCCVPWNVALVPMRKKSRLLSKCCGGWSNCSCSRVERVSCQGGVALVEVVVAVVVLTRCQWMW